MDSDLLGRKEETHNMKKQMNKIAGLGLTAIMVFALTACSSGDSGKADTGSEGGEKRILTFAQHNSQESLNGQTTQTFADYVNENSDTLEIDVYYNGELGGIQEAVEGVSMGTIDITASSFAQLATLHQDMEVFSMPYLVTSGEDNQKLMDMENNEVLQEILEAFEASSGLKAIGTNASYEARELTANRAIYKPEDLSGLKIRSITNDVYTMTVEGLGGTPVPIDWTETPTALSTGTVEGQENPYSTLVDYQLWDVQKYIMETNHIYDSSLYIVGQELWDSFTDEEKEVIQEAVKQANEFQFETQKKNQEENRKICEENGMEIITEEDGLDIQAFKDNTDELKNKRYAKYQDYFDRLDEYLGY